MRNEKFTPTVAYFGPEASFTHVAASTLFGSSGLYPNRQFRIVLKLLQKGMSHMRLYRLKMRWKVPFR